MNVRIRIDELILHGLPAGSAASVGDALRRELAELLRARGIPPSLVRRGATDAIDGGALHLRDRVTPERIGGQLASAVYGSLEGK